MSLRRGRRSRKGGKERVGYSGRESGAKRKGELHLPLRSRPDDLYHQHSGSASGKGSALETASPAVSFVDGILCGLIYFDMTNTINLLVSRLLWVCWVP